MATVHVLDDNSVVIAAAPSAVGSEITVTSHGCHSIQTDPENPTKCYVPCVAAWSGEGADPNADILGTQPFLFCPRPKQSGFTPLSGARDGAAAESKPTEPWRNQQRTGRKNGAK
jgi:hypothetical protein